MMEQKRNYEMPAMWWNNEKDIADLPFKTKNTTVVIIRGLPVLQCDSCRQYELEDETMKYVDGKLN